jgi:hypothetical protein
MVPYVLALPPVGDWQFALGSLKNVFEWATMWSGLFGSMEMLFSP